MRKPIRTITRIAPMKYRIPAVLKVPTFRRVAILSKARLMKMADTMKAIQTIARKVKAPQMAPRPIVNTAAKIPRNSSDAPAATPTIAVIAP